MKPQCTYISYDGTRCRTCCYKNQADSNKALCAIHARIKCEKHKCRYETCENYTRSKFRYCSEHRQFSPQIRMRDGDEVIIIRFVDDEIETKTVGV